MTICELRQRFLKIPILSSNPGRFFSISAVIACLILYPWVAGCIVPCTTKSHLASRDLLIRPRHGLRHLSRFSKTILTSIFLAPIYCAWPTIDMEPTSSSPVGYLSRKGVVLRNSKGIKKRQNSLRCYILACINFNTCTQFSTNQQKGIAPELKRYFTRRNYLLPMCPFPLNRFVIVFIWYFTEI